MMRTRWWVHARAAASSRAAPHLGRHLEAQAVGGAGVLVDEEPDLQLVDVQRREQGRAGLAQEVVDVVAGGVGPREPAGGPDDPHVVGVLLALDDREDRAQGRGELVADVEEPRVVGPREVARDVEVEQRAQVAALVVDPGDEHVHGVPVALLAGGRDVGDDDDAVDAFADLLGEVLEGDPEEVAVLLALGEDELHVGQARRRAEAILGADRVAVDRDELEQALGPHHLDRAHAEPRAGGGFAGQGVHERARTRVAPAEVARPALPCPHLFHGVSPSHPPRGS